MRFFHSEKADNKAWLSASEEILATSASILCLKSERSAGSGKTYTQSFMKPHRYKSLGVRSGDRGGHAIQALSGGSLQPIHWLGTVIFNQSCTERGQRGGAPSCCQMKLFGSLSSN
ncbi:hypothetical protein TNCV_4499101 [Trichonephila clavipes]|nr:hypothetical protein TNCV_4499101 [Trichonephila clavipes]